ncbi:MAG: hypothetical protein KDC98_01030 [Planctomycetes bacterium]|nr:hypothetical protein [Planctomycetota bacterium]
MRKIIVLGIVTAVVVFAGAGGGFASMSWSGEIVATEQFAAEQRKRGAAGKRPATRTWQFAVQLEPTMNPLAGTVRIDSGRSSTLRVYDPAGEIVFERRVGASGDGGEIAAHFVNPIEVQSTGLHRFELEVNRYTDVAIDLRRNALLPTPVWMFSMVGLALLGMLCCMFGLVTSSLRKALR